MEKFKVEFVKFKNGLMLVSNEARYNKVIGCEDIEACTYVGTSEVIKCDDCIFDKGCVDRKDLNIIEVEI